MKIEKTGGMCRRQCRWKLLERTYTAPAEQRYKELEASRELQGGTSLIKDSITEKTNER